MAQCPKCQKQIEIGPQFYGGLFTCPHCQAVYFTSFDGVPEGATGGEEPVMTSPEPEPMPSFEPIIPTMENPVEETPVVQSFEPMPMPMEVQQPPVQEFSNDFPSLDSIPAEAPQSPASALQEIVSFGNQEVSSSPLVFNLKIKGLDLIQSVSDLQDVLTDAKLGLKFEDLKRKIKNGVLVLEKLDPAKAAVIAQRLRALPVEMEWEQKIYE